MKNENGDIMNLDKIDLKNIHKIVGEIVEIGRAHV